MSSKLRRQKFQRLVRQCLYFCTGTFVLVLLYWYFCTGTFVLVQQEIEYLELTPFTRKTGEADVC
jgi:hypothetical protein